MENNNLYPLTKTTEFRLKLYPKDFFLVKDFYENTLGYPIVNSWDYGNDKGVMFNAGTAIIELITPRGEYLPIQGSNISLQVEDVWALWEKLKDHPNIVKPLGLNPWVGGDVSFRINDPEGFRISFFSPKKST